MRFHRKIERKSVGLLIRLQPRFQLDFGADQWFEKAVDLLSSLEISVRREEFTGLFGGISRGYTWQHPRLRGFERK